MKTSKIMRQLSGFFNRYKVWLICGLLLIQFLFVTYFQRGALFHSYDTVYWKDRFEHSQWQLPLSQRILGDDGLYEYVGYTLIHGADPSLINAETPPVGKYFLGMSIVLFHNPLIYSLLIGLCTLIIFFFLCNYFFKNTFLSLFCSLLFFLDPLFFSQLSGGWIDSTQLFFLLLHFFCLFTFHKKSKRDYSIVGLSGLSLGLFAQSKFPVLLPCLFLIDGVYLFLKNKKALLFFICFLIVGDLLPYGYYFLLHHSLLDFIRLQKYILSFYLKSGLHAYREPFWTTIFLGRLPNITSGVWEPVKEWSITWPCIFIIAILSFFAFFTNKLKIFVEQKRKKEHYAICVFLFFSVTIFSFIPFYSRYLLLIVPFLYLLGFSVIARMKKIYMQNIILIIFCVYGFVHSYIFLQQDVNQILRAFAYNFSHGYFQDMYQEDISQTSQDKSTRSNFFTIAHTAFTQAGIKAINIRIPTLLSSNTKNHIPITVEYTTQDLGSFSQQKSLHLVKENNQWKIVWDWNLLFDQFLPGDTLVTTVTGGKRGSISSEKSIIAQDTQGLLVSVIPEKIDRSREPEMLNFFSKLSGQKGVHLQNAYLENVLPYETVALFTTFFPLTADQTTQLRSFPGVLTSPYMVRSYTNYPITTISNTVYTECCSRIYSSSTYHGISGLEKRYETVLSGFNGGSLILEKTDGHPINTFLKREPKNGKDVTVSM